MAGGTHALLLARWELGQILPEDVPEIAVRALQAGCDAPGVAILASLRKPTRLDVEDELETVCRECNLERPSAPFARKQVTDDCARRIVAGSTPPFEGACELWDTFFHHPQDDVGCEQLRPFVDFASDWEDDPNRRPAYERGIVDAAATFLAAGGLHISGQA